MKKLLVCFLSSFFLYSCASQAPAPIEFKSYSKNIETKSKITKREIKLSDDSISSEDIKQKSEEKAKDDEPFVTIKQIKHPTDEETKEVKKTPVNSRDLEREMDELESKEHMEEDAKAPGDRIAPKQNPHHISNDKEISLIIPVNGKIISKFGDVYMGKKNSGINIASPIGTDIKAASDGAVIYAGDDAKFGNLIVIKHNKGDLFSAYAHMNDLILQENTIVKEGQIVGHVGKTGDISSPQLHFAIRKGKTPVDPMKYIK